MRQIVEQKTGSLHVALIDLIRQSARERNSEASQKILRWTDAQLLKNMFVNVRTDADGYTRGLRLSSLGLTVMRTYFAGFEVEKQSDDTLRNADLLYLDAVAILPYYVADTGYVIFETELGIKLKLVDGCVARLIEMDSGRAPK